MSIVCPVTSLPGSMGMRAVVSDCFLTEVNYKNDVNINN